MPVELGERGFTHVLAKVGDVGEVSDRFGLSFGYTLPFPGVEVEAATRIGPKNPGVPVVTGFSGIDEGEVDRFLPFGLPVGEVTGRFACRKLGVPKLFRWQALLLLTWLICTDNILKEVGDRPVRLRIVKKIFRQRIRMNDFQMTQLVHYAPEACRNRDVCCIAYKLDMAISRRSVFITLMKQIKRTL